MVNGKSNHYDKPKSNILLYYVHNINTRMIYIKIGASKQHATNTTLANIQ